ncbi:MAG: hydantoinase/oxoprolinase family protein [Lautropia sp.]
MSVGAAGRRADRVAVDIGGTFTDFAGLDAKTGTVRFEKSLSTPGRLAEGVEACMRSADVEASNLGLFVHGSTVAINAVIQRTGARTALLATEGFTDVYGIGRANRPDTYNLFFTKVSPLVPAELRFGVRERLDAAGRVVTALDALEVARLARLLARAKVQAIAVCLLHSYANPAHEAMLCTALREALPGVFVTASHEVLREYREYERSSTTVLNAYVGGEVTRYLDEIDRSLAGGGFDGHFLVMQSNGGVMTVQRARRMPVAMMESGPAGGIVGAAKLGCAIGFPDVIAFDMGGTTAKTCLIEAGLPKMTDQYYIGGHLHGHPMRLPAVDIIEVGAGGGSIAWIDVGGGLHVGPRSAGAEPGPACYGKGGREPTVTDANLVTGRLNPKRFLGGEFDLDTEAARNAIASTVAAPLGLDELAAAHGIIRLADTRMALAVNAISLQRGYDPRRFTMVAFGGAGPLHAMAIARELHIPTVVIPPQPGHFSALGMLLTDLRSDLVLTKVLDLADLDAGALDRWFAELEASGLSQVQGGGLDAQEVTCVRSVDMRYLGQEYTVSVPVPDLHGPSPALAELRRRFDSAYEIRYGHQSPHTAAQIVNLRVAVLGKVSHQDFSSLRDKPLRGQGVAQERPVCFDGIGSIACRVYQRADLRRGDRIDGPAIIEEYASTTVLHQGDRAVQAESGCLVVTTGRPS